jgi:hypothetical protein
MPKFSITRPQLGETIRTLWCPNLYLLIPAFLGFIGESGPLHHLPNCSVLATFLF